MDKFLLTAYYQSLTIIRGPINYSSIDFVLKISKDQNDSDNEWEYNNGGEKGNGHGNGYGNGHGDGSGHGSGDGGGYKNGHGYGYGSGYG